MGTPKVASLVTRTGSAAVGCHRLAVRRRVIMRPRESDGDEQRQRDGEPGPRSSTSTPSWLWTSEAAETIGVSVAPPA